MSAQLTTLSNGLRIVTERRQSLETVSVGIWVNVGARRESEQLNGITHCLEHMVFKGTKKRSARDIAFEIEAVGGHLNAYTTRDYTTYYARVMKDDLPLAFDILSDIVLHSKLEESELEREKDVIIQEIGQSVDTPDDIVFDHLQEAAFKGQPIGRSILGTPASVQGFNRKSLTSYMADHYRSNNVVVSAVGNLEHDDMVKLVEEKLAELPDGSSPSQPEKAIYTGGALFDQRDLEQVHVALGFPGCSYFDPKFYAFQLYSTILGGGMSSLLFQEIREMRGLAYSVYSFASSHHDTGLFGIYAGTAPDMAHEAVSLIMKQLEQMAENVAEEQVAMAKAQLKSGLMMALEATTSRMEQLGRQILIFDRVIPVGELIDEVSAVNADQVKEVGEALFGAKEKSIAAVGGGDLSSLQKIIL